MAIPISGSFSIGSLRTELQNTGLATFSLREAGRPTTGAPGTFQNPRYTPVNQSSSYTPNNTSPFQMSEWRGYSHTENSGCKGESYIMLMNTISQFDLYRYDYTANTASLINTNFSTNVGDDIAITRNKLFHYVTSAGPGPAIQEYDITLLPWSIATGRFITTSENMNGIFAKNNTTIVYWRTSGLTTSVKEADITTTSASLSTLFTINANTYYISGEIYYDSANNKYLLPYSTGGLGVAPFYVGRWSSTGTLEASVPVNEAIDGLFTIGSTAYGIAGDNDIYLLNFSGNTSSYTKTAPLIGTPSVGFIGGVTQYDYPTTSFTSPDIGTFYTYYRVAIRGTASSIATIDVTGNSTTGHACYIYLSYPFDTVGQRTGTAWTFSQFTTSTTKTFVREMATATETLHFVLFEELI